MAEGFDKAEVVVGEVEVRPARPDERRRWDAFMAEHHYLGFRQFAGRGLRHVAVWRGHWLALVGWQSGAFKCAPRDRWLRWHRSVQFRRLHLIANNTRFLVLPAAAGVANLASRTLGRSLRRLSADWAALHGHPLELAETFVDPSRFRGGCYDASNWVRVGRTKGFARHNGGYTDPHDCPKEMFVRPLRADARPRLADPGGPSGVGVPGDAGALHARGAAFAARAVRGGARQPPRPGPQAPPRDGAVGVRAGAAGRAVRPGGDGAVREEPRPGGAARAGRVAQRRGALGRAVGLDGLPSDGGPPTRTPCRTCCAGGPRRVSRRTRTCRRWPRTASGSGARTATRTAPTSRP